MKYSFHPKAKLEFENSVEYYKDINISLGIKFFQEVLQTIQRILSFPNAWQVMEEGIRRCLVNKFPFGIIYYQKDDEVIILAVMQLNKKPNYWKNRLSS